ncbi:hypothetical protein [Candidatus Pantoea formicae]|uniref:hypothetical protein n=1 Tax=Candidatus Pantoea formicae TaxID=2608355 RepID=UPI003EDA373F
MVNYQKVSILIHDGLEDEFFSNGFEIQCPFCDGVVHFGLYNSLGFNKIEEDKKINWQPKFMV